MAIFLITGGSLGAAKDLAEDLAPRQVLQGHDDVVELIKWLREARKLSTGLCHWAVYNIVQDHIPTVYAAFPPGHVMHFHIGEPSQQWAHCDWYVREGARLGSLL